MDSIEIPDKTYFKIGEVAKLLELEPYVLRYWETEFDVLSPQKTKSGQRSYQRPDIELLVKIQRLLYEELYTIAGARRQLKLEREGKLERVDPKQVEDLRASRQRLEERLEEVNDDLAVARREAEARASEIEALHRERSELGDRIDDLEVRAAAAEQLEMIPGDDVVETVERLEEDLQSARERIAELESERESLSQRRDRRRRRQVSALAELRQHLNGLRQVAEA